MLRTEQILNAKFTPVSKGTYSAEEVDSFLKSVADSYESLLGERNELIKKISILADKIESYRNDEEAIKLSLLDAHRMAETINKNAKINAENLIGDAETRSKIIVDGANRQSAQMIDEAKEKAKEIVDNARTAVASLTDRAQKETDAAINAAQAKAAEIVAAAEEEGKKIIGNSKESYEFYSAELERIQSETSKFKAYVEELCKNQLSLLADIPETVVSDLIENPVVEEKIEDVEDVQEITTEENAVVETEETVEPEIEAVVFAEQETVETSEDEAEELIVYDPEETESETVEEVIDEPSEILTAEDDDKSNDEIDDLFSFIDEMSFDDVASPDEIPENLNELVASGENTGDVEDVENVEEENLDEDNFEGFKIDLDSLGLDDSDSDNDDITSLFDSMFDD